MSDDLDIIHTFSSETQKNIQEWLEKDFDANTKKEILQLVHTDPDSLKNAFFQKLSFGTAGARGIMGVGTNRFNIYTIRGMAQGVANYLKKYPLPSHPSVVIAFDNRNNSALFAKETAQVLAANHIKVYLCNALRPTPFLSFAVRQKEATAGIMITASHNPPLYNGFKVYWSDGGQILPPHDTGIIEEVNKIEDLSSISTAPLDDPLITPITEKFDHLYLERLQELPLCPDDNRKFGDTLKIIYSNLHGTGITLMPQALQKFGFSNFHTVPQQEPCLGSFAFAPKPNPEEKEALKLGMDLLVKEKGDIFIASDPDADRIGLVVLHKNAPYQLTGNQVAAILLDHICSHKQHIQKGACVKSIVTTRLMDAIAQKHKIACIHVLTGFKYIAQQIKQWEQSHQYQFIFGAEESCGYLHHTFVRDKDAISTGCLIGEAALQAKKEKKTLVDKLFSLYQKHGIYRERLLSIAFKGGKEGMDKMQSIMKNLRKNPPKKIGNIAVTAIEDYLSSQNTSMPKSNVLLFTLDDKSTIIIRPSGTEPKIKIYMGIVLHEFSSVEEGIKKADSEIDMLGHAIQSYLN